jgi:hypothetical protein
LREICPPKKKTPKSGANIGAIAGELLIALLVCFVLFDFTHFCFVFYFCRKLVRLL